MKRIIILGAVVLLVVVAWTGAWFWGAGFITDQVRALASADGVTEPKLTCGSFGVGGYPFGFDLTCTNANVSYGDVTVTASGLKAAAQVYNPTFVLVSAQSPVSIADAFTGSQSRVDFEWAQGSARLTGWRIGRISLVVEKPVWNDTVLEDRLIARAGHVEAHLVDLPEEHDAKAGLAGLGQYVQLEELNAPGFTINAAKATLESSVDKLPDDVRTYSDPELLKRWQAAGGSFTLKGINAVDGDTSLDATGALRLDDQGRLNGQLKLHSKGVVERVGPSIPEAYRGWIVGAQGADGSYSQTVNIAAGVVFAGLIPAGMVPPAF
jgi:hypothetical protein